MAVAVDLNFPGATADQYDAAVKRLVMALRVPHMLGARSFIGRQSRVTVFASSMSGTHENSSSVSPRRRSCRPSNRLACLRRRFSSSTFTTT